MKKYLQLKNIYKSYGEQLILENINFSILKGEFLAVLGPSGCGKTTLLKLMAGFLKANEGEIYQKGERIAGVSSERIMVFQEYRQLFPWKTVLGNVIFALQARGIAKNEEREKLARYYLQKVELAEAADYYPHQLSGGMKQKAALARALAADPEILLMDEPFGSLDSQTRAKLQELLLAIWQESRKTIIFVTHDLEEAILLADRIIVMAKSPGKIKKVIVNNLKRPRQRTSREFTCLYEELSKLI